MRFGLFIRLFLIEVVLALLLFAFTPDAGLLDLLKMVAIGAAVALAFALFYPEIRGIKQGDLVAVVANSAMPVFFGKNGIALSSAKVNNELTVRFDNGEEIKGTLESYAGFFTLPKVRAVVDFKPPINFVQKPQSEDAEPSQGQLPPPPDSSMYR
jgi:hypothetical protein